METFSGLFLAKYNANLLITGNLNVTDAALLKIDDPSTKELIEVWSCLNFNKQLSDFSNIPPIWYNSLVRIDNKPNYYKNWYKAGILFRKHLLDENFHFLNFDAFKETFSVKINFLQYQSVVKCSLQNEINLRLLSGSDKHRRRSKQPAGFNGVLQVSL